MEAAGRTVTVMIVQMSVPSFSMQYAVPLASSRSPPVDALVGAVSIVLRLASAH